MTPDFFYHSLEKVYDLFFPLEEGVKLWLDRVCPEQSRVLDLGCGTGEALLYLGRRVSFGLGIDLDEGFIRSANEKMKKPGLNPPLEFHAASMTDPAAYAAFKPFRTVFSLGNTIAHLDGTEELSKLLGTIRQLLSPGGEFWFQILNYDRILAEKPGNLPPLVRDGLELRRSYRYPPDGTVEFSLSVHSGNDVVSESGAMPLYPFRESELVSLAGGAGFSLECFGDFSLHPRDPVRDFILLCRLSLRA